MQREERSPYRGGRPFPHGLSSFFVLVLLAGCNITPPAPPYPYYGPYGSADGVTAEARKQSAALEQYVKDWLDGKVSATLPENLIPEATRKDGVTKYTLLRPNQVDPNAQWGVREAHTIDRNQAYGYFNDPHATYLLQPALIVPFGSKVIIEGQFPHARFFSVQASPAFTPNSYKTQGYSGQGEVSWFDADIEPLPSNTNPYRVGANRNATNRSYRLVCNVAVGDPTVLDSRAWTIPDNRHPGNNTRHCSGIAFRGPWGDPNSDGGNLADRKGFWEAASLWIRYYAPDKAKGVYGGVPKPKLLFELPDGRQYYIAPDITQVMNTLNRRSPLNNEAPGEPTASLGGPGLGWGKNFSIFRGGMQAIAQGQNYPSANEADQRKYVRDIDKGVASKGEDVPGIGRHESHATAGVHIHYLGRAMCLGAGKVAAIAGTLPTTPKTTNGEATMTAAQSRYWSITAYSNAYDVWNADYIPGLEISSLMDDEIVVDSRRRYLIVFSRAADRPANATAQNGVTWVDWGPEACVAWTIRWLTAGPDWTFDRAPDQRNLGWEATWASSIYDPNKVGRNNRNGFLKEFQPVVSYMTKSEFEARGNGFDVFSLPAY